MSPAPDSHPTPLNQLRVVEISDRIAGSYCGKLLLDAGADVCKIEPLQGDSLRRYSATCSPVPDGSTSPFFSYLNAGKRSLTCAPHSERYTAELAVSDDHLIVAQRITQNEADNASLLDMMSRSNLKSELVPIETVRAGARAIRAAMTDIADRIDILVCDAQTEEHLAALAQASLDIDLDLDP